MAKMPARQTEDQASSVPDMPSSRRKPGRLDKEGNKESTRAKSSQDDPAAHASRPKPEPWQVQKAALKRKLGDEGWQPRRRLSPDAVEGIRAMHAQFPDKYTTPMLAKEFKVSPEAIRRILKSKWRPTADEAAARNERWTKRGEKIWTRLVELGMKPPKKWRDMGIGQRAPSRLHRQKGAASASGDGDFWVHPGDDEFGDGDASQRSTALADRIF